MTTPQDRLPAAAPAALPRTVAPLEARAQAPSSASRIAVRLDPARALIALAVSLVVTGSLYTRGQFPLMLLIAVLTITGDRSLAVLKELANRAVRSWRSRRSPAGPPRQRSVPPPRDPRREPRRERTPVHWPKQDENLRPVAFAAQSDLGTMPWRLSQLSDRSGVAADQALVGGLELRAVSVVGPAHRIDPYKARPCQDAYRVAIAGRGRFLIAAVADGVSNARLSHEGAALAAHCAVRRLKDLLDNGLDPDRLRAEQVFPAVANQLLKLADDRQRSASEFATTLITAVIPTAAVIPATGHAEGGRPVWLGWIADSSAWVLGGPEWRQLAGEVKTGYDPNLLSVCLPNNPKRAQQARGWLPDGHTLALMTDGLSDLLTDVEGADQELARRWAAPPTLAEVVRDLCFDAPGQDDDRTAVLVWTPHRARRAL